MIFQLRTPACQISSPRALTLAQDHLGLARVDWADNDPPIACDEKS
jgi:hypothetical protein